MRFSSSPKSSPARYGHLALHRPTLYRRRGQPSMNPPADPAAARDPAFPSTHWTLIQGVQSDSEATRIDALETLCRTYWYPIYCFVRRRGLGIEEAEDAVQDFFARVLTRGTFAQADQEKGRLRTWLLAQLTYALADRARRSHALKRGGGAVVFSFDALTAEERYRHEPAVQETPEHAFERTSALAVVEEVLDELRAEHAARGHAARFDAFRPWLVDSPRDEEKATLCKQLGVADGALRVALHRFRESFRSRMRRRLLASVETAEDLEAEIASMSAVLTH